MPDTALLYVMQSVRVGHEGERLVGRSPAFLAALREAAAAAADADRGVLLVGEPGVGKCLIAAAIHAVGSRRDQPFRQTMLAAIPSSLMLVHLFGWDHARCAAPTGRGPLERAGSGTLFLGAIHEADAALQARLASAFENRWFEREHSGIRVAFEARIICTAPDDLSERVRDGRFSRALYDHVAGTTIHVPPLRDRPSDIPLLVHEFIATSFPGRTGVRLAPEALAILQRREWARNLIELGNWVAQALSRSDGEVLEPGHFPGEQ